MTEEELKKLNEKREHKNEKRRKRLDRKVAISSFFRKHDKLIKLFTTTLALTIFGTVLITKFLPVQFEHIDGARAQYGNSVEVKYDDIHLISSNIKITNEAGENLYTIKKAGPYNDCVILIDANGEEIGHATDDRNVFKQDDHWIRVNDEPKYKLKGGYKIIFNKYNITDDFGRPMATLNCSRISKDGYKIIDLEGSVWAELSGSLYGNYRVTVYENCPISDTSVLLIYAAHANDMFEDAEDSGND